MHSKFSRVDLPKIKIALSIFVLVAVLVLGIKAVVFVHTFISNTGMTPPTIASLIFGSGAKLRVIEGRTNIVLLGIGGAEHEGADLTDTILVLSFNQTSKTLSLVSLPRDVWSDTLKDKVNSAYHYGEEKKKGGGLILSKAVISDMVGLPIDYGLVFDFSRFRDIINLVGGIVVDVPQAFTDTQFPILGKENDLCNGDPTFGCRYESLHFNAGTQMMDGDTALKYVRSRHAQGAEGSDFARSTRQQEVLLALKAKITSKQILFNPSVMAKLYQAFDTATDTDMNIGELLTVGKMFIQTPQTHVTRISLEDQLYEPPSSWYGRFVLVPKESFESIHTFIANQLK